MNQYSSLNLAGELSNYLRTAYAEASDIYVYLWLKTLKFLFVVYCVLLIIKLTYARFIDSDLDDSHF